MIVHPVYGTSHNIKSIQGRVLLKQYLNLLKHGGNPDDEPEDDDAPALPTPDFKQTVKLKNIEDCKVALDKIKGEIKETLTVLLGETTETIKKQIDNEIKTNNETEITNKVEEAVADLREQITNLSSKDESEEPNTELEELKNQIDEIKTTNETKISEITNEINTKFSNLEEATKKDDDTKLTELTGRVEAIEGETSKITEKLLKKEGEDYKLDANIQKAVDYVKARSYDWNLKRGFVGGSSEKKTIDDTKPIDTLDNPLTKNIIKKIISEIFVEKTKEFTEKINGLQKQITEINVNQADKSDIDLVLTRLKMEDDKPEFEFNNEMIDQLLDNKNFIDNLTQQIVDNKWFEIPESLIKNINTDKSKEISALNKTVLSHEDRLNKLEN